MPKFTLKQTSKEVQESLDNVFGLNDFCSKLGNKVIDGKWVTEYKTVDEDIFQKREGAIYNIVAKNGQVYNRAILGEYGSSSTFSGWMSYIGSPEKITYIKVPGKLAGRGNTSAGESPTAIKLTIYRVPKDEELSGIWKPKGLLPADWERFKLFEEEQDLVTPLTDKWEWQTIKLSKDFINQNNDMLMLCYQYNTICSACFLKIVETKKDVDSPEVANQNKNNYPMGWNSFAYYTTATKTPEKFTGTQPLYTKIDNINTEFFYVNPVIIGSLDKTTTFYNVNTNVGGNFYNQVSKVLQNANIKSELNAEVLLPKEYDLVVGDTFQLFLRSVIKCYGDYHRFGINCVCSEGDFYPDYFEWTPEEKHAGKNYNLKIVLRDLKGKVLVEGETILRVHNVPSFSGATTKNMCVFGDSLTSSGSWAAEGIRRLVGTSDLATGPKSLKLSNLIINTYGTKKNTINTQSIRHEGYGGWTWNTFLTNHQSEDSTEGSIIVTLNSSHNYEINTVQKSIWTDNNNLQWELEDLPEVNKIKFNRGPGNTGKKHTINNPTTMTCKNPSLNIGIIATEWEFNPFWDEKIGDISFKTWAKEKGCPNIDIAACLLTWNAGGASSTADGYTYQAKIDSHMTYATTLLKKLHSEYPNAKIICMGIQIPSLTGGSGANYHATGYYSDMWGTAFYAWDYNKALEKLCLSNEFKDFVYYVDTKGQFDSIHNMPSKTQKVNTRSNLTYTLGTNGVHPSTEGYYQIGDAFFRKMVAILNENR